MRIYKSTRCNKIILLLFSFPHGLLNCEFQSTSKVRYQTITDALDFKCVDLFLYIYSMRICVDFSLSISIDQTSTNTHSKIKCFSSIYLDISNIRSKLG